MKFKKFSLLGLFAFILLLSATGASAATTPLVTSFTASPQAVNYGYTALLSWNIVNGSGHDLYFSCPAGVTIKRNDGSVFPCNTNQSISANASDSASFYINNVNGTTESILVKVIPKDTSGADYYAGASMLNISVGAVPHPITDFSFATTSTTALNFPVTLSWTGLEIGGANMQFDCQSGVQIYSTNPAVTNAIPCGQPAYATDLPQSGTVSVYFVNNNQFSVDQTVRIIPAISAGVYDATHAQSVVITIPPKPAPVVPSVSSFTSPLSAVLSGQAVTLSWVANNTSGVNLEIPCGGSLSWGSVIGTTTTPLLCGVPAFSSVLPLTGSTTVSFTNNSLFAQSIAVSLFPQKVDGTYDGTTPHTVNLLVLEPGHVTAPVLATTPTTIVPSTQTTDCQPGQAFSAITGKSCTVNATGATTNTSIGLSAQATQTATGSIVAAHPVTFSSYLHLGSHGSEVSALQSFFKQDSSLYPEGLVTGYFGPLTLSIVERFQVRYSIANPGDAGYGLIGPLTRAKLNSMSTF